MIIEPKVRGFICTTAHPIGCQESVRRQIEYVKSHQKAEGPKRVLIIGASTGYGLASRIAVTYGYDAMTLGVIYEKPGREKRTATPGYYNTKAFEEFAQKDGYYAQSINADAFLPETKEQVVQKIKDELGTIDLVIYSLAAPRRSVGDITYSSVLKTIGEPYTNRTLDLRNNEVSLATIPCATPEEILATKKVMGGEDWELWMKALHHAGVLSENVLTVAYSYIGPQVTNPIYRDGTIGKAKEDLYEASKRITKQLSVLSGKAYISVNKALVTQASAAIPMVPLYLGILYHVMKKKGIHEGCIEQMARLYLNRLPQEKVETDELGRIRMDDLEMNQEVQQEVNEIWEHITTENLLEYADIKGYWDEFYHMFGFGYDCIDYTKEVEI